MTADLETRLHNWGTGEWIRRDQPDEKLRVAEDCAAALDEIQRLRGREHDVAVILATALACGDYSQQHAHWIADAAKWLNDRRAS